MPDFPQPAPPTPLFVHTVTDQGIISESRCISGVGAGGNITWVANIGIYQPVSIPWPYLVNRVFWVNGGTLTGPPNADFGIYTLDGTRIYSCGPTAQSGASNVQFVTVGSPFVLGPGSYYFAWSSSGSALACGYGFVPAAAYLRATGALQQASVGTLPATATFAAVTNAFLPLCGITRTASGF